MSVKRQLDLLRLSFLFLSLVVMQGKMTAWGQSGMSSEILSPPSLVDFTPFLDDPLNAFPNHHMQYPANLFTGGIAGCVVAQNILQSGNAEIASQRLREYAFEKNSQGSPVLSLQAALDLGLCHNPQLRMTWSDIKIQASRVGQAKAAYLPQLNAAIMPQSSTTKTQTYFLGISLGTSTQTVQSTSGNIGLSWRVLDFGTRSATLESAYHQLAGAMHSQNEVLQKTIIGILQAYYVALTKKSQWLATIQIAQLAEQTLGSAQRRVRNGVGSQNDVLQAQSSLSKARLEEKRSDGEYQKALASLVFQIGLPANTAIDLDNILEEDMLSMKDSTFVEQQQVLVEQGLQEWLNLAKRSHPTIAAARSRWQSAQSEIRAVSAQGLPTIDLGANYYRNGRPTDRASNSQNSESNLTLTINIPIFSGFDHTYRVRGAQAQAERASREMDAVEQQVMLEIIQTHADALSSWHNLAEAENFYTWAALARLSSQRQFEGGVSDITQVIQAQSFLVDAQQQRIEAYAQWQIARMTLIVQSYAW